MQEPTMEQIFGTYMPWKINEATWVLSFMNGSQYLYLLEGSKKALLIDTGFGACNLKPLLSRLTDKPVMVVNTHFHPDHAGGNGEFEEVWMSHSYQIDEASVATGPFDLDKMPHPDYVKHLLHDGDVIELGDRSIVVKEAKPAHCNSLIYLMDEAYGQIFGGDEVDAAQVMLFDNSCNDTLVYDVEERLHNFRDNLSWIIAHKETCPYVMPCHNGTPLSYEYVEDLRDLPAAIYEGTAVIEDKLNHPFVEMDPKAPSLCRVRHGLASIFIKKEEVLKVYGKGKMDES